MYRNQSLSPRRVKVGAFALAIVVVSAACLLYGFMMEVSEAQAAARHAERDVNT